LQHRNNISIIKSNQTKIYFKINKIVQLCSYQIISFYATNEKENQPKKKEQKKKQKQNKKYKEKLTKSCFCVVKGCSLACQQLVHQQQSVKLSISFS